MFFSVMVVSTTLIYTLSLHDALPIYPYAPYVLSQWEKGFRDITLIFQEIQAQGFSGNIRTVYRKSPAPGRSEEHTSELQSRQYLVCRLLLEKKKNKHIGTTRSDHPIS